MPMLYPSLPQVDCTAIPLFTPFAMPSPAALSSFHRNQG
jgi:hypothetical protein